MKLLANNCTHRSSTETHQKNLIATLTAVGWGAASWPVITVHQMNLRFSLKWKKWWANKNTMSVRLDPTAAGVRKKKSHFSWRQKENAIFQPHGEFKDTSSQQHKSCTRKKHVLEWPNQSPELNPTQNMSKDLQKIVDKRCSHNPRNLEIFCNSDEKFYQVKVATCCLTSTKEEWYTLAVFIMRLFYTHWIPFTD